MFRSCIRLLLFAVVVAATAPAGAQVDTRTNRVGDRQGIAPLQPRFEGEATISAIPRYYLDTLDVLERKTSDFSRPAPGLAKNNYIAKAYPIKNTRAIEIQTYLLRILAFEGGIAEVMGLGGVDADGPATQFLLVTMPDFMEPYIDDIVAQTDIAGFKFYDATGRTNADGIAGAVQYVGKHRTASELSSILAGTELGNVGVFLFPPFADDSTNSIYIVENPTDIADDIAALTLFDKPPLQVELHAVIYEIKDAESRDFGLDWTAWKRFLSGSLNYNYENSFDDTTIKDYSSFLTLDAIVLADFLNFLARTEKINQLTDTYITMVNSEDVGGLGGARGASTMEPATISTVRSFSFQVGDTVSQAEDGVTVDILPFIGVESLTLDIDITVASLVGFAEDGVPLISSTTSDSVVNLVNGQTIVLGGFEKKGSVETNIGIPWLNRIRILEWVFGNEVSEKGGSKILIALTPRIKSGADDEKDRITGLRAEVVGEAEAISVIPDAAWDPVIPVEHLGVPVTTPMAP